MAAEDYDACDALQAQLDALTEKHEVALKLCPAGTANHGPGRPGTVKRPSRFPMKIHFVWGFCMGAQGA